VRSWTPVLLSCLTSTLFIVVAILYGFSLRSLSSQLLTDLPPGMVPCSFLLAAYKSWDMEKLRPGYDSPLSGEVDIVMREEAGALEIFDPRSDACGTHLFHPDTYDVPSPPPATYSCLAREPHRNLEPTPGQAHCTRLTAVSPSIAHTVLGSRVDRPGSGGFGSDWLFVACTAQIAEPDESDRSRVDHHQGHMSANTFASALYGVSVRSR